MSGVPSLRSRAVRAALWALVVLGLTAALSLCPARPAAAAGQPPAPGGDDVLTAPDNGACLRCHERGAGGAAAVPGLDAAAYRQSPHGRLACTSCHLGFRPGPHDAVQVRDWRATARLEACRACHADVFSRYSASFHGRVALSQPRRGAPACADCHDAHAVLRPGTAAFREGIDDLCARCHADARKTYLDSYHGKAFLLGRGSAAVCTDCHGSHRILPPDDPRSSVNKANLVATCQKCHPGANSNFAGFMVHVNPRDPRSSLLLWFFYAAYVVLIAVVFSFGFVHSGLYIYRGIKDGLYSRHGPRL